MSHIFAVHIAIGHATFLGLLWGACVNVMSEAGSIATSAGTVMVMAEMLATTTMIGLGPKSFRPPTARDNSTNRSSSRTVTTTIDLPINDWLHSLFGELPTDPTLLNAATRPRTTEIQRNAILWPQHNTQRD